MISDLIMIRLNLNLTLQGMADRIGVSKSYYEKIEQGERNPSYNFLCAFKNAFPNVILDDIFFAKKSHKIPQYGNKGCSFLTEEINEHTNGL